VGRNQQVAAHPSCIASANQRKKIWPFFSMN